MRFLDFIDAHQHLESYGNLLRRDLHVLDIVETMRSRRKNCLTEVDLAEDVRAAMGLSEEEFRTHVARSKCLQLWSLYVCADIAARRAERAEVGPSTRRKII